MKTLEEIKIALSSDLYKNSYGASSQMGTPEGIQAQFDNAQSYPANISYLDLGVIHANGRTEPHTELVTVIVDENGDVVGSLEERYFL